MTIASTLFFLGYLISSISSTKGSFPFIEPKIKGDDFVDTRAGSEKWKVLKSWSTWQSSGHSYKENMADFMVQPSVLSSAFCGKLLSKKIYKLNCLLTSDIKLLNMIDVVVFTHTSIPGSPSLKRKSQICCFSSQETCEKLDNVEWIMSYHLMPTL